MTFEQLLDQLVAENISLRRNGDRLDLHADGGVPAALVIEGLRLHKPALLAMIGDGGAWPPPIRPEMLTLVSLTQEEIDRIVASVAGGAANVQDIYPLAPLQDGILFHHLLATEGDPYLVGSLSSFASREGLDRYLGALQAVVDRHDILRTAVMWEGLREPVQVVWKQAPLKVEEVGLDPADGGVEEQLQARFDPRHHRIALREAPMMRAHVAHDGANARWLLFLLRHHFVLDHTTTEVLWSEIEAHLAGRADSLPEPLPFRNYVAQTRLGVSQEEHREFFAELLGDVEEPTAPFGLLDVRGDGSEVEEARLPVEGRLAGRLRERARSLGVSAATLCHVAWAQVLARVSGRDDVVFGTVLFGRMHGGEGSERVMGPFINTLPIRIHAGDVGVEVTVRQTHALLARLLRHEHASLAVAQRCSGVEAPVPLFTSLLNYRHSARKTRSNADTAAARKAFGGMRWIRGEERTNYPLTLSVDDLGEGFWLTAQIKAQVEARRVCALMHTALEGLVEALEGAPGRAVGSIDVLPASERALVVEEWNRTEAAYPGESCVHELFEHQVERTPEAVAVVFEGEHLTYAELNRRANRLAHHLRALGVGPDVRVGLCVERSREMMVGVLGILKAGGAYVPTDPGYPPERLEYMLADSAPAAVLTQTELRDRVGNAGVPVLELDAAAPEWTEQPDTNPERGALTPAHLAYVIYTSGSTGRPKGVLVPHRNVARLFAATEPWFEFGETDVWTLFHSVAFDFSVWEMWGALLYGGRLVVVPGEVTRSPEAFYELVCDEGVTVLNQTPSAFYPFMNAQAPSGREHRLRHVVFGGEALDVTRLRPWFEKNSDTAPRLVNMYGITETTVHVTWRPLTWADVERAGASPIGERIPDLRAYLLDRAGEPVPVGVAGELYVGGAGVARGYLGRPELTAERFVADAYGGEPGGRLYRTGDLARWLPDGTMEYLGRTDHQVKVRGFRIELGEIEARLAEHVGVREAVVLAREDVPGEKRLVAYVVGNQAAGADVLRAHLSRALPAHMVPAAYVRLEQMPLTPNGKVDRKVLPPPEGDAYAARGYEAPVGETEQALAEIWAEVLGVERVGRHDNFFEMGGHSLLAVQVIVRLRQRGLHAEVRALFTAPTLAALAAEVGGESREVEVPANGIPVGCERITPGMLPLVTLDQGEVDAIVATVPGGAANVQDIYPLAPLQEGILFHHLVTREGDPYLLVGIHGFSSRTGLDRYLGALQAVVDRHDVLRTAVVWEGLREPVQVVWRKAPLEVEEVKLDPAGGDAAKELYARFDPRHYRIDPCRAPMMRACIAHDEASNRWLLLQLRHHLISDHTTGEVLGGEIEAHLAGRVDTLPEPLPFRNYVAQARLGVSHEEHREFFTELLGDVEEATAPFGLLDVRGDGAGVEEARLPVEGRLAGRLRERARSLGVSAATLCHVAWAQVLSRVSGRDDVVFGTVLFGRMQGGEGSDRVMGPFINTLPVRIRVGKVGAEASVRQTHALLAKLLRHEHASLALAQRCSAVEAPAPLFTSLLNFRHSGRKTRSDAAAAAARTAVVGMRWIHGEERTNYPLMLSVDDLGEGFRLTAQIKAQVEARRVCALMHTALEGLVEALEGAPGRAVGSIDVLPASERALVVEEWNRTEAEYPGESCIHELFEAQVERTPTGAAVVFEGEGLTCSELNARANRLAHHLRSLGVGPDARVGICAERSLEMMVGLLGVLKAGGAYVPLDPGYPAERLAYMLADSAPAVVLAQTHLRDRVESAGVPVLELDAAAPEWANRPATNPERGALTTDHLAYVIYTSGSTGRPKGVGVHHRGVVNRLSWMKAVHGLGSHETVLQKTPYSFDVSLWELFWPLAAGARLVLARPEGHRDPAYLLDILQRERVTTVHFVPSLLAAFLAHPDVQRRAVPELKRVMSSGEALPPELVARFGERLPGVELHNLYGPTEASVDVTFWRCPTDGPATRVSIGRPVPNTRIYLVDQGGEPVPVGVAGELYIGGVQVARGYLGRSELTAERFVADPFGGEPGARLYRTGDRARWLPDGTIEYLGRIDFQVKVRGFRIELGEIEARLQEHADVREAVVLAREDAPGDRRLVAYVVGPDFVAADALRAHLSERLPEYMVPSAFVRLERLPLAPNGKLDRKALPAPEGDAYARRGYEAPAGETEQALAEIWADVLRVERVGRWDHFFELGGHSLLAVQMVSRLRQALGVELPLSAVFKHPVFATLVDHVLDLQLARFDPEMLERLAGLIEAPVPGD